MKPFLMGVIAAIAIAIGAHYAMDRLDWSSAATFSSSSVRL
jgi:hypothetical protein